MIKNDLAIFEDHKIRRIYDKETDTWFFSVVDVVQVLTQQADYQTARKYWSVLKTRLKKEGSESTTKCSQLKLKAPDGKKYLTDVANVETLLRLIQSIPSPKVEPFKLWLAKVGYERIQEIADPERSLNRARDNWSKQGRSNEWIQRRMSGQETRNKLTDYWQDHDIKEGQEYATLTNIIHQECFGSSINKHQKLKGLEKKHNLRDHMTEAELLFTALAELSTRQIAESMNAKGLTENKNASKAGGKIAKTARLELEDKTGQKVISNKNYLKSPKRIT
ncbi:MAG: Bro-N domain-containing protein [Rickettsiaceae bacterium]|nr:Bro-N domain-containing protein [Erysipelotrichaceae bacterium]MCP5378596.1 Bro-N domain-containing protein [Rickettsiaceae bacterium]